MTSTPASAAPTSRARPTAASRGAPSRTSAAPWDEPRALYLQHGSDPVVWWSPNLFFHRPDWLKEPRAPDVSLRTAWFPVVTFIQVTVDQFYGTTAPNGYGHNYATMSVAAWSAVAPPPGWTAQRAQELQASIDKYRIE